MASHNNPFTSRTKKWCSLCIIRGMSWHETFQVPIGKSNLTSFVVSTWWSDFMCMVTLSSIDIILLFFKIFFPQLLDQIFLSKVVIVRIHIVIQHTSLTYHTHIHTQTHNMDESIHKYPCTTTENVMKNIYYHKTHDANTYSQVKPTPLRESRSMLIGHHNLELH
jgi:hypothetical protein